MIVFILVVTCIIIGVIVAVPLVRGKLNQSDSRSSIAQPNFDDFDNPVGDDDDADRFDDERCLLSAHLRSRCVPKYSIDHPALLAMYDCHSL